MSSDPVTIVIPSWNGRKLLGPTLDSVRAQTYDDVRTIVVDNGSSDGTDRFLAERYPWVDVVDLGSNRGFTGAVNAGIRGADTPLIALVNNDVQLSDDWLEQLVTGLAKDASAG